MVWETPFLNLDNSSRFALSSITLALSNHRAQRNPVIMTTNLMDADQTNPSGIISIYQIRQNYVNFNTRNLEFWQIDCNRPRQIIFKFENLKVSDISYISIVLAFEENGFVQ